ncbi:hypothetical protein N658DRAFT_518599 [Parathielavia hyrcaniae]|uniref:Uncharacterized protein n=1 Tax=Parathielavia hyrcaniae TaxID=113614 RepID=A0AAN6PT57_9PEZI|nr:hypothetical protein N658DRAFT_518599 [Parathielavia hyrcaniae]
MPTYFTPPQTPITTSSPPLSRSNSYSASSSDNTSSSDSRRHRHNRYSNRPSRLGRSSQQQQQEEKEEEMTSKNTTDKIPYLFLGSIAAASLVAHKCWPKGFPQGDREDWELSELGLRARQRRLAEKAEKKKKQQNKAARWGAGGDGGVFEGPGYGCCCCCDDERGFTPRRGGGERAWNTTPRDRESRRGSMAGHDRGSDYRDFGLGRYSEQSDTCRRVGGLERFGLRPTTEQYCHPAPKRYLLESSSPAATTRPASSHWPRYLLERSSPHAGPAAESSVSSFSQPRHYDNHRPGEVAYVYRESPPRSRRASFNVGGLRRYEDGYGW